MPSLRPKGGGDNPFARARGASPPPPPVTRFLNNLNKITISATVMNNNDPLSYLPVQDVLMLKTPITPKQFQTPRPWQQNRASYYQSPKHPLRSQ